MMNAAFRRFAFTALLFCAAASVAQPITDPAIDGANSFVALDIQCHIKTTEKRCENTKGVIEIQKCKDSADRRFEKKCLQNVYSSEDVQRIVRNFREEQAKALQDAEARARKRELTLCRAYAATPDKCPSPVPGVDAK